MRGFRLGWYTGKWYELAHTPSWFQLSDDYNTTATYTEMSDGTVKVVNRTYNKGQAKESLGTATRLGDTEFFVDFSEKERAKLVTKGEYTTPPSAILNKRVPNYIVSAVWYDLYNVQYKYAVVTNDDNTSVYILSRTPCPPAKDYAMLMEYAHKKFGVLNLHQTPHYSL